MQGYDAPDTSQGDYQAPKDRKNFLVLAVDGQETNNGSCVAGDCLGIKGTLTPGGSGNSLEFYLLEISAGDKPVTGQIWSAQKWQVAGRYEVITKNVLVKYLGDFGLAAGEPFSTKINPPRLNGYILLDVGGGV